MVETQCKSNVDTVIKEHVLSENTGISLLIVNDEVQYTINRFSTNCRINASYSTRRFARSIWAKWLKKHKKKRDQTQFYPDKDYFYCLSQQLVRRTKIGGILYKADKDSDPGPLEKVDSTRKFTVWVKDSFLDKFKGADFKYDNSF